MKLGIFLIIFSILYWYLAPKFVQADENWTPEFKKFCAAYMPYVNKYKGINAGCCDINHPSNDIMKEGWKGETLLICDGKEIV
ncbi:hypothetical protein [uncultured Mediterranean phage uvMED]|nr:hypothetical protein [uncultured Mediterranean phage uvMED]